jgi:hypothetical protein
LASAPGEERVVSSLRPVGGVDEIQVIGALPDRVADLLGLKTSSRSVWLHPNTAHHISTRRGVERGEADFVLSHMPLAILRPHYCGCDPRSEGRYDLVFVPEGAPRAVFVALKIVPALQADQSEHDEIWVSTAHPLARNFLSRKRYRASLRPVKEP